MAPDHRVVTEQLFHAKYGEVLAALLRATGYEHFADDSTLLAASTDTAILYDELASMISAGRLIVSASLQGGGGKTLRGGGVSDGPYSETKEAVAGLLLIRAADYVQATELASACPFLVRGGSVEVREAPQVDFEAVAIGIAEDHARARFAQKGA